MSDKKIQVLTKQIQDLEKKKAALSQKKLQEISEFISKIGLVNVDINLLRGVLIDTQKRILTLKEEDKLLYQKEGKRYSKTTTRKAS